MEITKQLITPSFAKQLLEANIKNRGVKAPVVSRYAQDIKAGRWKQDTGESIKISKTGVILDGQHRLYAVIKAETPTYFHVAKGLEDSVFDVLDTGTGRSASDVFKIDGISHGAVIPSIIALNHLLKQQSNHLNQQKNLRLTNAQILSTYYDDTDLWQEKAVLSLRWYANFQRILTPSTIGAVFTLFSEKDAIQAEDFMSQLCTGLGLTNSTIGMLRQKLIQDKISLHKMSATIKMALIIKCWNYYRQNKAMKLIKYDHIREEFPKPL